MLYNKKKDAAGFGWTAIKWAGVAVVTIALMMAIGCGESGDEKILNDAVALAKKSDKAMTELDWASYASMVRPADLDGFKNMLVPQYERIAAMTQSDSVTFFDQRFSLEDFRSMSSDSFFTGVMSTVFSVSPELTRSFSQMKNDFIGAVAENDSTIHVVAHTKMEVGTRHVDEMNVVTAHKIENVWKLGISSKIQGVGYMLVESLQMQR